MDVLYFSLVLAAVVIGFWLVFLRMSRTDALLHELRRLRDLEQRLQELEAAVRSVGSTAPLAHLLTGIREDLAAIDRRLERAAAAPIVEATRIERVDVPARSPGERLRDMVEARLYAMGFQQAKILSDLKDVGELDEVKVTVECQRDEVAYKGTLAVRNGAILEAKLLPVLQVFP